MNKLKQPIVVVGVVVGVVGVVGVVVVVLFDLFDLFVEQSWLRQIHRPVGVELSLGFDGQSFISLSESCWVGNEFYSPELVVIHLCCFLEPSRETP